MTSHRSFRGYVLAWSLDLICLAVFALACLIAPFKRKGRTDALHSFTRNFWGARGPSLDGRPVVWVHAVSVGEMRICQPVLAQLIEQRPELQFVLSLGTTDAMNVARSELPEISLFYAPFDFSWAVRRTFDSLNPVALIISENDFWAQMLNEAKQRNVPLAIFNTRMSPREQTEHRWNAWLLRSGLKRAAWWGAVSEQDAEWIRRFFHVDTPPLEVTGSVKFDGRTRDPLNPQTTELKRKLGFTDQHRILVAGSTHDPEEKLIAGIVDRIKSEASALRVVIVPRTISRAEQVFCDIRRVHDNAVLFSEIAEVASANAPLITVVDSIGLLQHLWGLADIAFVGGSLARNGGHNMIEPASYGKPVCFGPHVWSFQPVVDELLAANAAMQVQSEAELEAAIRNMLSHPDDAAGMGQRALAYTKAQGQSLRRTVQGILPVLPITDALTKSPTSMISVSDESYARSEAS